MTPRGLGLETEELRPSPISWVSVIVSGTIPEAARTTNDRTRKTTGYRRLEQSV